MFGKAKRDVLINAIIVAIIYVIGLMVLQWNYGLAGAAEDNSINALGDSIGGLTAPLALIFVIAAVIIQRQELALTKTELAKSAEAMERQVEVSLLSAQANYKFMLFDKRLAIYNELNEIAISVGAHGKIADTATRARFIKASMESRNLFGDEVNGWLEQTRVLVIKTMKLAARVTHLHEMNKKGALNQDQQEKLESLERELFVMNQELCEKYDWDILDSLMLPYLKLPENILIQSTKREDDLSME